MPGLTADSCSITVELLQQAAEAALVGEQPSAQQAAALAGAPRTLGLLSMLKAAVDAAMRA